MADLSSPGGSIYRSGEAILYYWYVGPITQDIYDIAGDQLERGNTNEIRATLALFESNVEKEENIKFRLTSLRCHRNCEK